MINKDFFQALDDLEREKKINKDFFIQALESALTSAYKKNFGQAENAMVKLNPEKCTIRIYGYKTIVADEEYVDPDKEIPLKQAKTIKKSYKVGDIVSTEVFPKEFGRISAQIAKQVVMQKLLEAEHNNTMSELSEKQNELITCIIRRIDAGNIYVEIPGTKTEGVLQPNDQIPGENYSIGSRIKVYVKSLKSSEKLSSLIQVTRSNTGFVKRLFELEVPEIGVPDGQQSGLGGRGILLDGHIRIPIRGRFHGEKQVEELLQVIVGLADLCRIFLPDLQMREILITQNCHISENGIESMDGSDVAPVRARFVEQGVVGGILKRHEVSRFS